MPPERRLTSDCEERSTASRNVRRPATAALLGLHTAPMHGGVLQVGVKRRHGAKEERAERRARSRSSAPSCTWKAWMALSVLKTGVSSVRWRGLTRSSMRTMKVAHQVAQVAGVAHLTAQQVVAHRTRGGHGGGERKQAQEEVEEGGEGGDAAAARRGSQSRGRSTAGLGRRSGHSGTAVDSCRAVPAVDALTKRRGQGTLIMRARARRGDGGWTFSGRENRHDAMGVS